MNEKGGQFAGSLNLVASSTIGNYVLPYLVTAFKSMHPDVHFNMLVYNTRTAEKLIIDRAVDLGFVEGEVNNEQITVEKWFKDELETIGKGLKAKLSTYAHQKELKRQEDAKKALEETKALLQMLRQQR